MEITHSERLMPTVDLLMREAGLDFGRLSGIAVAIGPGSFTGLRIGLASAKGLALASALPLFGIPTLEAMARNLPFSRHPVCPMLNARKREVYWALYRFEGERLIRIASEAVSPPEEVANRIRGETVFLGDGAAEFAEALRRILGEKAIFAPPYARNARASVVAEMGMERLRKGERDDLAGLVPLYVRRSEAEIKWGIEIGD